MKRIIILGYLGIFRERGVVIVICFTEQEISELRELVFNHPHPIVRRRGLVVLLKSKDYSNSQIHEIAGVCENTMRSYLKAFKEGGLRQLSELNLYHPVSELKSCDELVRAYLEKTPPCTIKQACAEIGELTGIYRKETQMRQYLKSLGASPKKVRGIPAKADIESQENFKTKELEPRLEEAKAGKRDVYFVDAAHFVLGAFLGMLWCITRVFVRTPSGRQRFNVLGALNAVTHKLVSITNSTYITSIEVGELLKQLACTATKPITVVLDNARYQRCHYVTDLAKELHIELLFLPPYSPNLNLIERLWKLVKKKCLYSQYHPDFQQFQGIISDFLDNMQERHAQELNTLLRLNFQTFTEDQIRKAA